MIPQQEEVIMYDHIGLTVNDVGASSASINPRLRD
jgi:hypothetical protein